MEKAAAPAVTEGQIDLVRRTVAVGATPDELKLYLYDCARQGVHPLDKLIHFTKRKGKYTPITSIDFMRTRAADSGEYAGSDDAAFVGDAKRPDAATVTVYRLVGGMRCPFTGTARWDEYYPGDGEPGFMWRKMPHTMLGKCAEGLALRKGFPRQLAGLYTREQMDQAGEPQGYTVEAPRHVVTGVPADATTVGPSVPNGGDSGHLPEPPKGAVYITRVRGGMGKAKGFLEHSGQQAGDGGLALYQDDVKALAESCCQDVVPVHLETKTPASGKPYVKAIVRVDTGEDDSAPQEDLSDADIPF
jgi:phage recombination protein Bet